MHIPFDISNSIKNPLFEEIRVIFNFNDPILFSSEHSREVYLNFFNFFNFFFLLKCINYLKYLLSQILELESSFFFFFADLRPV